MSKSISKVLDALTNTVKPTANFPNGTWISGSSGVSGNSGSSGCVGVSGYVGMTGSSKNNGISGTVNVYGSSNTTFNTTINKCKYNVLGTDIEVSGYFNDMTGLYISIINVIGIEVYIEMRKNNLFFPVEIGELLDIKVISFNRNKSINQIISNDPM